MGFRFGHLADIHLDLGQFSGEVRQARRKDSFEMWAEVCQVFAGRKCQFVLLSGDLYDRQYPSELARSAAVEGLRVLDRATVKVFAIPGNHDSPDPADGLSSLHRLEEEGYLKLIDQPGNFDWNGVEIWGLPWCGAATQDQLVKLASSLPPKGDMFRILMVHCGIEGLVPASRPESVSTKTLMGLSLEFDYIALGHIHKPFASANVYMPGSLEVVRRNEARWNDRGFYIVEVADDGTFQAELIRSPDLASWRPYITLDLELAPENPRSHSFLEAMVYDAVQEYKMDSELDEFVFPSKRPIISIKLTGVRPEWDIDLSLLRKVVELNFNCLYVDVRNQTTIEQKADGQERLDRGALEFEVFGELLGEDAGLAISLKDMVMTGEPAKKMIEEIKSD